MQQGQQFPEDFLAQHGFSPAEQEKASRTAESEADWLNTHHDAFHENLNDYIRHITAYHQTGDHEHFLNAKESAELAKGHNQIYHATSGQSLLGKDDDFGNCTHCGGFLGSEI
jgi:hypothetical protein